MQVDEQHPVFIRVSQAYKNLGYDLKLETMPLARLEIEAAKGDLIGGNLAAPVAAARLIPQLVQVPVPIYQLELTAFVAQPDETIRQWSDLREKRVVYLTGMLPVEQQLEQQGIQRKTGVMSMVQALQFVAKGRMDVAVLPRAEAEFVLRQMPDLPVRPLSPPLAVLPLYHYIHQKHQTLVEPLTRQLRQLMAQPVVTGGN